MTLKRVPPEESIYHNIELKNGKIYFYFDNRYKKYVQADGYELILDKNNKPVYIPEISGTYNYYTYNMKFEPDWFNHKKDIDLWKDFGAGPNDRTTYEQRLEIGDLSFGSFIQSNYKTLSEMAKSRKDNYFTYEELIILKRTMQTIKD